MTIRALSSLFVFTVLVAAAPAASADTVLRIATLAPEGSSWMKLFHQWQKGVETGTQGRVKIKFYSGGVQGDEKDVLRKIKLGQLSGAAITGIGLAAVNLEVRALDLAQNYGELDYLRSQLGPRLSKSFADKGYILLGWGDVGPVHLFSNKPVTSLEGMKSLKLWLWSDDPISKKLFDKLDLHGVPMGVPDVLPGLSTGSIDAFFGAPLSTLALQWSTKVKYMTTMIVSQATGATLVSKAAWVTIGAADQKVILDEGAKLEQDVLKQVRGDNVKALESMKARGLQVIATPEAFEKDLADKGAKLAEEIGQTMSKDFQEQVRKLIETYRKDHGKK